MAKQNEKKIVEEMELTISQMRELTEGVKAIAGLAFPTAISFDLALIREKVKPFIEAASEISKALFEKFAVKKGKEHKVPESKLVEYQTEEKIVEQKIHKVELPLIYLKDLDEWKDEKNDEGELVDPRRGIPSGFIMLMFPVIRK